MRIESRWCCTDLEFGHNFAATAPRVTLSIGQLIMIHMLEIGYSQRLPPNSTERSPNKSAYNIWASPVICHCSSMWFVL